MTSTDAPNLWLGGGAYDRYVGRWSQKVAPLFTTWVDVPPQADWIDVGCGTGVLTSVVLDTGAPARVLGIDSAPPFLQVAESRVDDPRASFLAGDAQAIPADDQSFDVAVSGLVLNFVPDKEAMIGEMIRVVRPGGTVGLYVWDYAGHMQLMRIFYDVAAQLDRAARDIDEGILSPICRPRPLAALLARAGLADTEVRAIDIPTAFESFDDYWTPFLGGTGPAPKYCASLSEDSRTELREALRRRLPTGPDGEILLAARAWAAKGRVAAP